MNSLVRAPVEGEALGPAKGGPPSERDCWGRAVMGVDGKGNTYIQGEGQGLGGCCPGNQERE